MGLIPFGGRSVAIKLKSGEVFLSASSPLDNETRASLRSLGEVKYIIALDVEHHMSLSQYVKEYPSARLIGVEPLVSKRQDLKFDGVFGRDPDPLGPILSKSGEIQAEYFDAHTNKDVAILHTDSKTLIQADLLFNLPAYESFARTNTSPTGFWPLSLLVTRMTPWTSLHRSLLGMILKDKKSAYLSANRVAEWDFDRIIPCHGEIIEGKGKEAWLSTYSNFLN